MIEKQLKRMKAYDDAINDLSMPIGADAERAVKQRVNQKFFREAVLSAYDNKCCISGISITSLLIASHIKPWKKSDESEKTNPCNGLCLNALHDKAFDKGFMTINADNYTVIISNRITDIYNGETVSKFFDYYNGKQMILPEKFAPKKYF